MSENAGQFTGAYFAVNYRDYRRQNPPYKMKFYRELIERYTPSRLNPRVLDLGCAFGRFLSFMPENWRRFGIDISEYAIRQARQLAGTSSPANFAVASASAVPLRGVFDAIVAFDVIEHVPDLQAIASFVNSELDSTGTFTFVVPVYDGPLGAVVRLLDRDPTHVHKTSRRFWLDWAAEYFEIVAWMGVFRYLLPGGVYIHWPNRVLRSLSPAIVVIVRRRSQRH